LSLTFDFVSFFLKASTVTAQFAHVITRDLATKADDAGSQTLCRYLSQSKKKKKTDAFIIKMREHARTTQMFKLSSSSSS
jgi:hypothetical protein